MNGFKNIFKRQKSEPQLSDLPLEVDLHSHLLPGLDDGAANLEESLALITKLKELGFRKCVTTPHIMEDFYKNNPENIREKLKIVREAIKNEGIDIEIEAAAEYFLDEWFLEKLKKGDELLTFGQKYLLVESPLMNRPANLNEYFFQIRVAGYKPVLAHPERYLYFSRNFENYQDLVDRQVYLQVNLNSLTGHYSPEAKKTAEKLIRRGMVHFVGSDTHKIKHVEMLKKALKNKSVEKLKETDLLNNEL